MVSIHIVCFDIVALKRINARFGPAIGDQVLIRIADVFRAQLAYAEMVGRTGSDQFSLYLEDVTRREAVREAERLIQAFRENMPIVNGETVELEVVVGIHTVRPYEKSDVALGHAEREALKARKKFQKE